jgi:hypothetical protein
VVDPLTIQDIPDHVLYYEIFSKLVCDKTELVCDKTELLCDKTELLCDKTELLCSKDNLSNKSIIQVDKRFNSLIVDYMGNKIRNDLELVEWNKLLKKIFIF